MQPLTDTTQLSHQLNSLTLETSLVPKLTTLSAYNDRFIPNRRTTNLDTLDFAQPATITPTTNQLSLLVSLYQQKVMNISENEKLLKFNSKLKRKKENIAVSPKQEIKKVKRSDIAKAPFKILDAPGLSDDFYLNLLDWSSDNLLAVALESTVYLWSGITNKVTKLCEIEDEPITSLIWAPHGKFLSIGTDSGDVQIWDVNKIKQLQLYQGQHNARVATLAWSSQLLCSGSRDKSIVLRDVRINDQNTVKRLVWHRQEVCGLKWNFDEQLLASGGNDNKLLVWNLHSQTPIRKFANHTAAVKAIAWSPHQHGLLVSGGGTADRTIRFWNTEQNTQVIIIIFQQLSKDQMNRYRIISLQLIILKSAQRTYQYPWLLHELNQSLGLPFFRQTSHIDWTYYQSALSYYESQQ